ncbi:hypothetical protein MPH_04267 [Macrophomina phaseolina MS6]|uniref:Uncharacterized protein n=1 Tax=Macrophomina phaseolina (strain MS6) TaxID=1126212 RepID=K2SNX7_MACPH|nr:hypothetical protein MPH_04267 [Macrophomina phaseolina MS6]
MPLIYGEGQQKAFDRLRKKIDRPLHSLRQQAHQQTQKLNNLETKFQQLLPQMENRLKELGFPWETGVPEDQLKIDDGLGAEYLLPVELCETPELPGLPQVQQGHILLLEWNERHLVSRENWLHVVKGDRAVKLSFIMGAWRGPPRNRCMRCFKPRSCNTSRSSFKYCHSCKLAVRWVAPDYLPFEPDDTVIFDRDTYRDYQVASRRPKVQGQSNTSDASATPFFERHDDDILPSIDLVCHRLTMKWEPIYNIVHRYLFCRCVLRLSTPSRLFEEMTVLTAWMCPRHNTQGVTFRDYSELALPCLSDPYFDQFGGYNAFWALLHHYLPKLYHHLGGPKSITGNQLEYGYVDLGRMEEHDKDAVRRIARDYWFEVAEAMVNQGVDLPPDVAADFTKEKTRRRQEVEKTDFDFSLDEMAKGRMRDEFEESSMGRELKEIIIGNWNGVPHWTIED